MNRRQFIKRGALFMPMLFIPRLLRAQSPLTAQGLAGFVPPPTAGGGGGGSGNYTFMDSIATATSAHNSVTTPTPKNTVGAGLITVVASDYTGAFTLTDFYSNSYTARTTLAVSSPGGIQSCQIFDCISPITGSAHTWTVQVTPGSGYPNICVFWFSKTGSTPAYDAQSSAYTGSGGTSQTTHQIPSVTPAGSNELFISGIAMDRNISSVNSSFTGLIQDANSGVMGGGAYLIQGAAAAVSPTFTLVSATSNVSGWTVAYK